MIATTTMLCFFYMRVSNLPYCFCVCTQFAFLAFLLGHSLEAFGQWKALLQLMLSCEEAPLQTRTSLYVQLLSAVHAQLQHCLIGNTG